MLQSSCAFDIHIDMLSSSCELDGHMWVRQTHRHAIIILSCDVDRHIDMLLSSCELDRHIGQLSSSCEFDIHIGMLSSSCEFNRHIGMLSSSCAFDRPIDMLSSSCAFDRPIDIVSVGQKRRHAIIILWVRRFDRPIGMLSSSCELDRHIGKLSSSCEFDRHIIILWVGQTHRHAIILGVRHTHRHAIIILCVRQTHHLVSWTDTSTCYHQLVRLCAPNEEIRIFDAFFNGSYRYGEQQLAQFYAPQTKILDGRGRTSCRPFRMRFRSTFQRFLAQIRYSHPWKVLRKRILKGLQKVRPAVQNLRLGGVNFAPTI